MAGMEPASSCGPMLPCQPLPPIAHAPMPIGVMWRSLLPSFRVCMTVGRAQIVRESRASSDAADQSDFQVLNASKGFVAALALRICGYPPIYERVDLVRISSEHRYCTFH